jgi:hypothetical protein
MTGAALAVTTPPFPWYALLLVLLVAFDGRAEWLSFAVVRYLAVSSPLPGVHIPVLDAERAGYGLALAVVTVTAVIRWRRAQVTAQPELVTVPGAAATPATTAVPAAAPVSAPLAAPAAALTGSPARYGGAGSY